MPKVFVSYASEDRGYVAKIVSALEQRGWSIWWDRQIEVGSSFDKSIEEAIESADCIVTIWSETSVNSDWVRAEAAEGLRRNILVSVLIDDVRLPLLFRQKQAISLIHWKQSKAEHHASLSTLVSAVETRVQRDHQSQLPVSTQRAWFLDNVRNETEDITVGPGLYEAAKLTLEFFGELFVYPGEMNDDAASIVRLEGLDGVISIVVSPEGDFLRLTLNVHPQRADELTLHTICKKDTAIAALGELLVEASIQLQGRPMPDRSRLSAYLADRNLGALYHAHHAGIEQKSHRWEQAKTGFGKSMELDPSFTLARTGYAIACMHLGQMNECRKVMGAGLSLLGKESLNQLHRFRGMYHNMVAEDMDKAAAEFQEVVRLAPMERSALNNLAVCRFHQLDFDSANELSSRDLQLFPSVPARLENASLFALYAGQFDEALRFADRACRSGGVKVAQLIPALIAAAEGEPESALRLLEPIRDENAYSYAAYVDVLIALEDWSHAALSLEKALRLDEKRKNMEQLARKTLMKAELQFASSQYFDVEEPIAESLRLSTSVETIASACLVCLITRRGPIAQLARELRRKVSKKGRAYSKMAAGIELCLKGDLGESIDQATAALELMDLWPIRFVLGYIYKQSDYPLDASDQFAMCTKRAGEGLFALLDDIPTYRYLHYARANA